MPSRPRGQRRRGHHEGTGYLRKDGRWEWRVSLPDGSRRAFYGATKSQAKRKAEDALRDLENGFDLTDRNITVGDFLERWIEDVAAARVRSSTLRSYQGHLDNYLVPELGRLRLRDLNAVHVNQMLARMLTRKRSPRTANRVRATLRAALNTAIAWGLVTRNAAALAEPRRETTRRISPLNDAELGQFWPLLRDHPHGPLFMLAAATGLRQGELLALRWGPDIDLDAGVIHVHHTLVKHKELKPPGETDAERHARLTRQNMNRLSEPKTEQSRRQVAMSDVAREALRLQQARIERLRLLAAGRWREFDLVFPTSIGTFADGPTITKALKHLLAGAGIRHQRFHDLRHLTATLLLSQGGDMFEVKEMLGHSQISMTLNTYGHLTESKARGMATRIDQALRFDDKTDDKTPGTTQQEPDEGE